MSLIPERPLLQPLELTAPQFQHLRTIVTDQHQLLEPHGRALVAKEVDESPLSPFEVTELREDGSIFAADAYLLTGGPIPADDEERFKRKGLAFTSAQFEHKLVPAIRSYLRMMRQAGIGGAIHVGISMLRAQGFALWTQTRGFQTARGPRVYEGLGIKPDFVSFDEGTDISTQQATAQRLRPAFNFIWREFGYPESLSYDEEGKWNPARSG